MKTRLLVPTLLVCLAALSLAACSVRSGESLSPRTADDLAGRWGAVVVTLPDRVLWEREGTDRTEHGAFYLYENAGRARREWTEAITERLAARGFKLYNPTLASAVPAPLKEITPSEYAEAKKTTIVIESGDRGKPAPQNGDGAQFLYRPFLVAPGGPVGVWIDRPSRYDLAPYVDAEIEYVVAVDLTEWVLVVGKGGTIRSGYALVHVAVLDMADYRVRALGRIEKPATDREDWIFGPRIRDASYIDLRRGRTSVLAPALSAAGPRLADLVERHMGLISAEELRDRVYLWNE